MALAGCDVLDATPAEIMILKPRKTLGRTTLKVIAGKCAVRKTRLLEFVGGVSCGVEVALVVALALHAA